MPIHTVTKRYNQFLLPFLFFFILQIASAQKKPLRLFLIGNSFSQNATHYLPELSKEGGHELIIGRAELGGCSLQRHWEHAAAAEANPEDEKGKPYKDKSLKMLLSEGTWDVITLQQYSKISTDLSTYEPYATKLYEYVHKLQPNARIVFQQTWAYRSDSNDFGQLTEGGEAKSEQEMWEKSRTAYRTTAASLHTVVIPTGDAFWQMSSNPKWAYHKDKNFDFKNPPPATLPDQTHSLHVGYSLNKDKLGFDSHHASPAGCYLGALVWYSFLFQESPVKLTFVPEKVPADFAKQLRKTAWATVKKDLKASAH
ncbi:DUF4886 domain-containing protein [Runella sp.]|uniref:DUF4886 domain-containing protein n=1 Tax=Runella sp. TaxID=1960881 RepID=UPI003D0BA85D